MCEERPRSRKSAGGRRYTHTCRSTYVARLVGGGVGRVATMATDRVRVRRSEEIAQQDLRTPLPLLPYLLLGGAAGAAAADCDPRAHGGNGVVGTRNFTNNVNRKFYTRSRPGPKKAIAKQNERRSLRSVPFLPRTNALQIGKTIRASLSIAHRPTRERPSPSPKRHAADLAHHNCTTCRREPDPRAPKNFHQQVGVDGARRQ